MTKSKLKLVTGELPKTNGQIYIGGTKSQPNISYVDDSGEVSIVNSVSESLGRPILCAELYWRLRNRHWNKVDCVRYVSDGDYYYKNYIEDTQSGPVDVIQENTVSEQKNQYSIINGCPYKEKSEKEEDTEGKDIKKKENLGDEDFINSEYNKYFGLEDPLKSINQTRETSYRRPERVDIIRQDSTTYTSSLDLVNYINSNVVDNVTAVLTIQYFKSSSSEKIYCKDIIINAQYIKIVENNQTVCRENTVQTINNDVQIEYINGSIRIFPIQTDVVEYIISRCYLVYGNM